MNDATCPACGVPRPDSEVCHHRPRQKAGISLGLKPSETGISDSPVLLGLVTHLSIPTIDLSSDSAKCMSIYHQLPLRPMPHLSLVVRAQLLTRATNVAIQD